MAKSNTLPIYLDCYNLTKTIYQITHKFPKEYKYCLGEQINKDVLQLLYYIFKANHIRGDKTLALDDFMAFLEMVRIELRLAHDMNILTTKQMANLALIFDKIIKQAIGWQQYQKSRKEECEIKPELSKTKKLA